MAILYDVVSKPTAEGLCRAVNSKLDDGWELQGGIGVVHSVELDIDLNDWCFNQAMTKEIKDIGQSCHCVRGDSLIYTCFKCTNCKCEYEPLDDRGFVSRRAHECDYCKRRRRD